MSKVRLRYLILAALIFLASGSAFACRCAQSSASGYYSWANAVFSGQVVAVRKKRGNWEVTFRVARWWKGGKEKKVVVFDTDSDCSVGFRVGEEWLVYAAGKPLKTDLCKGSTALVEAGQHLKYLESLNVGQ